MQVNGIFHFGSSQTMSTHIDYVIHSSYYVVIALLGSVDFVSSQIEAMLLGYVCL